MPREGLLAALDGLAAPAVVRLALPLVAAGLLGVVEVP